MPSGRQKTLAYAPVFTALCALMLAASPHATAATPSYSLITSYALGQGSGASKKSLLVKNGRVYAKQRYDRRWVDISERFNGDHQVGIGEITSVDATRIVDETGSYELWELVRGGKVYEGIARDATPRAIAWEELSADKFSGTGAGAITSFGFTYGTTDDSDGLAYFLTRGGRLYKSDNLMGENWVDITPLFGGIGDPAKPITGYEYEASALAVPEQRLVRGGRVYRYGAGTTQWQDVTDDAMVAGTSTNLRVSLPNYKRVMVIEYMPTVPSHGNKPLWKVKHEYVANASQGKLDYWHDPRVLEHKAISWLEQASRQYVQYAVTRHVLVDGFPPFANNKPTFTLQEFMLCTSKPDPANYSCRDDGVFDYARVIQQYKVCELANAGIIDELWIMGMPFAGLWEANMAGPGAFDTNGTPISNTTCNVKLNVMGFNYEREPERMLENMGHRLEGTVKHKLNDTWRNSYGPPPQPFPAHANLFEQFTSRGFDNTTAGCGNIHGSLNRPVYIDYWSYDHDNLHVETNTCDDWDNYPNLTGVTKDFNCWRWGCSDIGWHLYWLSKIPAYNDSQDGARRPIRNNWWAYALDWDTTNH